MNVELKSDAERILRLSRLNESERAVLRLLAEGHTAKSIATTTNSTTAAVNERLREARRKTGSGSSRELARLLRAQENSDEQIGVPNPSALEPPPVHQTKKKLHPKIGVMLMMAMLTIAAAAALFAVQSDVTTPASETITDPDLGTFTPVGSAWLYKGIRQEDRDADWAPEAERALRERYSQVLFFNAKPRILRVMCRRITCEVAVSIPAMKPGGSYGDQEPSIIADMREKGLLHSGANITGDTKSDRAIYIAYYMRTKD